MKGACDKGLENPLMVRYMTCRPIAVMFILFLAASLACQSLSGSAELTLTPTAVNTPTLAPTATPDPNATPLVDVTSIAATGETDPAQGGATSVDMGMAGLASTEESASGSEGETPVQVETPSNGASAGGGTASACPASGQNRLINPSFEGSYAAFGAFKELNHAANWFPWWQDGANNLRPEFKPAEVSVAPNRIHSGNTAQQYFKSFGQFKAGLYQSVLNVTPGSRLQFSAHGQAWSCEEFGLCPNGTSVNPANMLMRVGIDPTGNNNWSADTVVWSAYFNPLDQWQVACVEAVAERDVVTVFLWASPDGPRQNQDVYWDDASLVVVP
jgi:hypothetical protein